MMTTTAPFVLGDYSKALICAFVDADGDTASLAKKTGCSKESFLHPPATIPIETYIKLLYHAGNLLGDEHFGLRVGEYLHAESLNILGGALLKAKTIGEALQLVLSLESHIHQLGYSQVVSETIGIRFIWHCHYQNLPYLQLLVESVLAGIVSFAQKLAKRSLPILEVSFSYEKLSLDSGREKYGKYLLNQSRYCQPYNSLLVSKEVLDWPILWTYPNFKNPANYFSKTAGDSKLFKAVTDYLHQQLPIYNPSLSMVAKAFNLSLRTFQRRLAAEGYKYKDALALVRLQMAKDYLRYSNQSAFEIAQILGFSEQSSFNHFFGEHMLMSPLAYRQNGRKQLL